MIKPICTTAVVLGQGSFSVSGRGEEELKQSGTEVCLEFGRGTSVPSSPAVDVCSGNKPVTELWQEGPTSAPFGHLSQLTDSSCAKESHNHGEGAVSFGNMVSAAYDVVGVEPVGQVVGPLQEQNANIQNEGEPVALDMVISEPFCSRELLD